MQRIALGIALAGILILLALLNAQPERVDSLEGVPDNTRVVMRGTVRSLDSWGDELRFVTDDFFFVCSCSSRLVGKDVEIEGSVERFANYTYLRAFHVRTKA